MNKFLLRLFKFTVLTFAIILGIVFFTIYQPPAKLNFEWIPKNNLSNNICFRAKMDHLIKSKNFSNCTLLIGGSSMSLCNISGLTIMKKTGECVYNISSWGTRARQMTDLLNILDKKNIKYLVCGFSNCDFGYLAPTIDLKATQSFIYKGELCRDWLFVKEMKLPVLFSDIFYRKINLNRSNTRGSFNFDETGSVLYDPNGFVFDKLWNDYLDTTGFYNFYIDVNNLNALCKSNNITLFLIYLPVRSNELTTEYRKQNQTIAAILKTGFGKNFVDLHNIELPISEYCDEYHLFKNAAEKITNLFLDSVTTMIKKQTPALPL